MSSRVPLAQRAGYDEHPDSLLRRDLIRLRKKHGLTGYLLIAFDGEYIHSLGGSPDEAFGRQMDRLGARILEMLDDGELSPASLSDG